MEIIIRILQFIIGLLSDFVYACIEAFSSQKGANAQFGRISRIASRFNKGFVISSTKKLSRLMSYRNLLISSPTGGGKTTKLLLPALLSLDNCSIICNDNSGELAMLSSGYKGKNMNVKVFDPSNSEQSCGYNILSRVKDQHDAMRIAHLIVATTLDKGQSDPFWSLSVKTMLQIFIRLVLHQEEQFRNMANVLHLVHVFSAHPAKIDKLIAATKDEQLALSYSSFIATPERTLMNVVASCKAALQLFESPQVAKVTSYDSIDFSHFRKQKTLLYLRIRLGDAKLLSCLVSIFFEQLYTYMLDKLPQKDDLDCFCLIDEASSLFIPVLANACSNGRKFHCGTILVVQAKKQLQTFYRDEAETICANCATHIHLGGQTSLDELRELEALSGKCTYVDKNGKEKSKSLVTVDEIRQLPDNRSLILCSNFPLIMGRVTPYWRNLNYKRYTKIPPLPLKGDIPEGPIPLIL